MPRKLRRFYIEEIKEIKKKEAEQLNKKKQSGPQTPSISAMRRQHKQANSKNN